MSIAVTYVTVGRWKENCYLIESGETAWLVDPGDNFALIDETLGIRDKPLKGIINTHGHFDHVGAVHEFKTEYKLDFYLHSKDQQIVRQANLYRRLAGDRTVFTTPSIDIFLDEIPQLTVGVHQMKIHHLPGHSNGSVCFEVENNLISGDILFKDAIGRTDLPGGDVQLLKNSVNFILTHFEGFKIYPGHGDPFVLDRPVIEGLKKLL